MTVHYLDASAWVKVYFDEPGSGWVSRFWASAPPVACSVLGLIEVLSVIARRHAAARLDPRQTEETLRAVKRDYAGFLRIDLDESVLDIARTIPGRYALRGSDVVHLASALRLRQIAEDQVLLVASDQELIQAARAEGLATFDPATSPTIPAP